MAVIDEIAAERVRQVMDEGWTNQHDDEHRNGDMARAAACYAAGEMIYRIEPRVYGRNYDPKPMLFDVWPWEMRWWKPKDRRRDLIKAAALIVAEIERLDRAT